MQMKIAILVMIFGMIAIGFLYDLGCRSPETKKKRAMELFEKVGGVDKINHEARNIFDQFIVHSKEAKFLGESDLKAAPAISMIGSSVGTYPQSSEFPAHIRIRYGSHDRTKFIFIFDPDKPPDLKDVSSFIQVTSNIFVSD